MISCCVKVLFHCNSRSSYIKVFTSEAKTLNPSLVKKKSVGQEDKLLDIRLSHKEDNVFFCCFSVSKKYVETAGKTFTSQCDGFDLTSPPPLPPEAMEALVEYVPTKFSFFWFSGKRLAYSIEGDHSWESRDFAFYSISCPTMCKGENEPIFSRLRWRKKWTENSMFLTDRYVPFSPGLLINWKKNLDPGFSSHLRFHPYLCVHQLFFFSFWTKTM